MTREEILQQIALLKKQQQQPDIPRCDVYGHPQLNGADPARVNGCCNNPVKK